jgi:hypothetical protein
MREIQAERAGSRPEPAAEATPRHDPGNRAIQALCRFTVERTDMASQYRIEPDRGIRESSQQLAVLRAERPLAARSGGSLAFPVKQQDIRPLAIGATREIAAATGWSLPYTLGVIALWKLVPSTARLCFAAINASPLMAHPRKRSTPKRRTWRPSGRRSSRRVRPRRWPW